MLIPTERLFLKKASTIDAPFYFKLFNDADFINNINDKNVKSVDETELFLKDIMIPKLCKNGLGFFTVFEKKSNLPIGVSSILKRENIDDLDVGYAFLPIGRGKGYAIEATKGIMNYANKTLKQSKVVAFTLPENKASQKVLTSLGFTYKGLQEIFDGTEDSVFEFVF